jgi:hypothetical protein
VAKVSGELRYRKNDVTVSIALYNSLVDVQYDDDYVSLYVGDENVYAPLGSTADSRATDLRVHKNDTTYAFMLEAKIDLPSGTVAIFDTAGTCPTGWTRDSDFDGKFLLGGTSYGAIGGGSHTHNVTIPSGTTGGGIGLSSFNSEVQIGSGTLGTPYADHTHSYPAQVVTSASNYGEPSFVAVVFCRKD